MRVAILNAKFYPALGGIENYIYYVSQELIASGHEVTVICERHAPDLSWEQNVDGIQVIRHQPYVVNLPKIARAPLSLFLGCAYTTGQLTKFLKEIQHDVDLVWARHPFYAYAACKAWPSKPILYIQASSFPVHLKHVYRSLPPIKRWVNTTFILPQVKWIERRAMLACNHIAVLSNHMQSELADFYRLNPSLVSVIPPGVDLSHFSPKEPDRALLEELSIDVDQHVVLTVCRLSPEKNVGFLIDAFRTVEHTDAILLIVGDGGIRGELERLAYADRRVRFVGFRHDVSRFYSIADLFVLPSIYEPFGQVLLEAMASGRPCIALAPSNAARVASNEIIEEGVTGYLVNSSSPRELAERLERLIKDGDLRCRMGRKAREVCEQQYRWSQTTQRLLELSGPVTV